MLPGMSEAHLTGAADGVYSTLFESHPAYEQSRDDFLFRLYQLHSIVDSCC